MNNEPNIAEIKWNEWCDKNGITNKETLTHDQIERFQMSDEFGDILNTLIPENQITYCIAVHAWNRLKKLYEEFKKEQAYYQYALALEPLLAKYEQWKASQPNVN